MYKVYKKNTYTNESIVVKTFNTFEEAKAFISKMNWYVTTLLLDEEYFVK